MNSLNSPLSLSKEIPLELLCKRIRLGCFGARPRGVVGGCPQVPGVPIDR